MLGGRNGINKEQRGRGGRIRSEKEEEIVNVDEEEE
jgi:hypothetical protein